MVTDERLSEIAADGSGCLFGLDQQEATQIVAELRAYREAETRLAEMRGQVQPNDRERGWSCEAGEGRRFCRVWGETMVEAVDNAWKVWKEARR